MDVLFITKGLLDNWIHLVLISVTVYFLKRFLDSFPRGLPPGPIGLPFVGYLPFLGDTENHRTYLKLSEKYGNIFSLRLGTKLTVVLNKYDLVKEALSNPLSLDRHVEAFDIAPEIGFVTSNGEAWHEQRSFCMQSMRNLGLGRGQWGKMIQEEVPGFLEELKSSKGRPTNPEPLISYTIGGNILSLLIGRRLIKGKDDETIQLTYDFSDVANKYLNPSGFTASIPGLTTVLTKLKVAGYDQASSVMNRFLTMLKEEGLDQHKNSPEYKDVDDFISLYLKKMEKQKTEKGKHYFSEANALGNMLALFLGGNDTIVSSLLWLIRLMAKHQDIQKKVHQELDDVIGSDGSVAYEDRFKIPFTFAVLLESQRYSCIVPLTVPRKAIDDFKVGGYTIPKGTGITSNLWAVHRDPDYWKYPDQFHPGHFLSEDGKKVLVSQPSFLPFTIGRRNCPGETVAWMEIVIFFSSIMQKFNICSAPGEEVVFDSKPGLVEVLKPQKLCFIERSQ